MYTVYNFVSGPMVWAAVIVFIAGSLYRLTSLIIMASKRDPIVFAYTRPHHAIRSMFHWLIPFMSLNMRKHPLMTSIAFTFHVCLILTPIFLFSHVILIHETWDVSWWCLPDALADIMTIMVMASCVYFLARRLFLPEVSFLTTTSDYLVLFIVACPFITGFWTYHQFVGFRITGILHIISGEILLISIPFTRLSHMLFYPLIRGYIGSEFGSVKAKDW